MERNGIHRKPVHEVETSRQKSSSLPNYAKMSVANPFAEFADDSHEDRASKIKEKNRRFNFFRKSKAQDESDSSSSMSSSSNSRTSTPKRGGGLLKFAGRCAKRPSSNGDDRKNGTSPPKGALGDSGDYPAPAAGRLSQSSRDLRESKKDTLSAFDLFASCKRSPSLLDSLDGYGHKSKKNAVKARVEAQRRKYNDTSSDDEEQWQDIKKYHSDETLHKTSKERRLRVARTERHYKRRTRDDPENPRTEDRLPQLERSETPQNSRNWTARASLSPSPQPRKTTPAYFIGNSQAFAGDGRHQACPTFASRPPTSSKSYEEHEAVLSCHLPIRKVCVDGVIPRAPTPPPRSANKFHLIAIDGHPRHYGQRPQSYAFESLPSPAGTQTGSETEAINRIPNGYSCNRKPRTGASRPLSFTTTSHVIYNHATPSQGFDRVCYSSNDGLCMSDSQISGKNNDQRRASVQLEDSKKQSLRNFNSIPKPWSPVPPGFGPDPDVGSGFAAHHRPPPSPSRNLEAFVFSSGKGSGDLPSPNHQPSLPKFPAPPERQGFGGDGANPVQKGRAGARPLSLVIDRSDPTNVQRRNLTGHRHRVRVASPPPPPTRRHFRQTQSTNLEAVGQKLDRMTRNGKGKTADNLEDALLELERIYESMKQDDEAFAEESKKVAARRNSTAGEISQVSPKSAVNSLSKTPIMGSFDSLVGNSNRPLSGSGMPNPVTDDLAYRKHARGTDSGRPSSTYLGNTGSYLMLSPALSPSISMDDIQCKTPAEEPHTVLDDLSFRSIRDANLQKVIEPQPPFGIPLGPVSQAASTDYLHAQAKDLSRPKMRRRFTPDVVKDDLAYRNLRRDKKDEGPRPATEGSSVLDFQELDNILSDEFQQQQSVAANRKKYRAIRSLSANISHLISKSGSGGSGLSVAPTVDVDAMEKSQSLTNLSKIVEGEGRLQNRGADWSSRESVESKKPQAVEVPQELKSATNKDSSKTVPPSTKDDETSSSTDTLTDSIPKPPPRQVATSPAAGDQGPGGDIWQVRVTLGSVNSLSRGNAEGPSPRLVKPVPVKLEVPKSDCKFSRGVPFVLKRAAVPLVGYVSDSDAQCKLKGLPIDEGQLDDLLSSLAQGARRPRTASSIAQRTSISCPQSPSDGGPTVFTDNATGEMSIKLVFPGLKLAAENSSEGSRTVNLANIEGAAERGLKTSTNAEYGVISTRRRDREMFPLATRTRSMVASGPTAGRTLQEKPISSIGFCNARDGFKVADRPPAIRRLLGSCAVETLDEYKLAGSNNDAILHEAEGHAERVARYKEERRKQLASQYGQWSSSGEEAPNLGDEPSYMRYSRRYKKKTTENGSKGTVLSNEVSYDDSYNCSSVAKQDSYDNGVTAECIQSLIDVTNKDFLSRNQETRGSLRESSAKSMDGVQSPVRSNRASRLRAKANCATNPENAGVTAEFSRQGSFRNRQPFGTVAQRSPTTPDDPLGRILNVNQGATPVSSSSEAPGGNHCASGNASQATTESESGGTASDIHRRPKDKSAKRKSNLNRMGALDSTPAPSDSGDDTPRRSRRSRTAPVESGSPSADCIQSDSLRSVGIVQSIQHQFSSNATASNKLESKDNAGRSNGHSNKTSDSQIKCRSLYLDVETSDSDLERGGSLRRSGRTALRRPKIPDIFRHKNSPGQEAPTEEKKAANDIGHTFGELHTLENSLFNNHKVGEFNSKSFYKERLVSSTKIARSQVEETESPLLPGCIDEKTRWELTKIPVRKTTLSILDNIPSSRHYRSAYSNSDSHNGHTLKISVGQVARDRADDDVSDTLKELTKLVRETTARVDCLTNAARNVDLDSSSVKAMGNRLLKGSGPAEPVGEPETFYTQVSVSTKTNDTSFSNSAKLYDSENNLRNGKCAIRNASQYAPDGNWQLGRPVSGVGDNASNRNVIGRSLTGQGKSYGSSDNYDENNDVMAPDRIATAYGTREPSQLHYVSSFEKKSCTFLGSGSGAPPSPPRWRKAGDAQSGGSNFAEPLNAGIIGKEFLDEEQKGVGLNRRSSKSESESQSSEAKETSCIAVDGSSTSILKKKSFDEGELQTKSILKHKEEPRIVEGRPPVPHSILKRGSFDEANRSHSPEKSSILKKRGSSEDSDHRSSSPEVVSILRRRSAEEPEERVFGDRHSILRRKSMLDEAEHNRSSILKKQCSTETLESSHSDPRPILKKKSSIEELEQSEPRPILKKRSSTEDEWDDKPKPILKGRRRSGQENLIENEVSDVVESRRSIRVMASSPVPRHHQQDELGLPPAAGHSSGGRHNTTSSEEEEFVSLPSSPDCWKLRKNSRDECFPKALKHGQDRIAAGGSQDTGSSSTAAGFPEMKPRADENGATIDSSEDEDEEDSSSSSSASSDEETARDNAAAASASASKTASLVQATNNGILLVERRNGESVPQHTEPAKLTASEGTNRTSIKITSGSSVTKSSMSKNEFTSIQSVKFSSESRKGEMEQPEPKVVEAKNTYVSGKTITSSMKESSPIEEKESGSEEDVVRLSVAARASLIMEKIQQQQGPRPVAVRRYANRRCLQRSQTQPVTVEEVQEAAKIAEHSVRRQQSVDELEKNASAQSGTDSVAEASQKETSESEEDPSKLSLAERVKLFNQKMVEERLPTRKLSNGAAVPPMSEPPRRKRVVSTRFRTQPVTLEEVEKAQRISPLATSLTRPPEPEILGTLPVRLACDLMHKCGEEMLLQKSANAQSSSSTDASRSDEASDDKPRSILKNRSDVQMTKMETKSAVLETSSRSMTTTCKTEVKTTESKVVGILKSDKASPYSERKPILRDSAVWQPPDFGKPMVEELSSSSSDEENESEGITINVRDPSPVRRATTSTDDDSSSPSHSATNHGSDKETHRIKNEAVLRRRNASLRKLEERKNADLLHSQSLSIESSFVCKSNAIAAVLAEQSAIRNVRTVTQRSSTQPLTRMEKIGADGVVEETRGSIAERLAALQVSQQQDWKRRLARTKSLSDDQESEMKSLLSDCDMKLPGEDEPASNILQKVSSLEVSQHGWRKRIEEKDAIKFTVAGKMGKTSPPLESPLLERKKRTPKPVRFQSRTDLTTSSPSTPLAPQSLPIARSKSMPMPHAAKESPEDENPINVIIPKADDGFCSFFEFVSFDKLQSQKIDVQEDAFNAITSESRQLLVQRRSVHVTRRHAGTKNPLKALAARQDLLEGYTEVKTGIAEKELKRIKVEQLAKHSDLATSALAGLASTEDFKSVNLRKSSSMINVQLLPYKDLMLLQVKGRRHVQCRLLEPTLSSLNKGDNFILVTPNEVYNWIGEFSNVIERAKGAEIASTIQSKRDLGYKGAGELLTFDEEKHTGGRGKRRDFFHHLGGEDAIADSGAPEEDEIYEAAIVDTNKVYTVEGDELVPYEKYWGCLPRIEMLEKTKAFVFDFGSEMYVWQGKLAPNDLRKKAVKLAQELWGEGYDYTECDINPLNPYRNKVTLSFGKQRPPWALFAKVNQHMETILFRSKFLDWPDMERIIKVKRQDSEAKSEGSIDLQPCDAQAMLDTAPSEPDLVLENCHLGRGVYYYDDLERRHCDIATLGIKVWHVLEYNHNILPLESWGQFHSGDTYVVRWQYRVTVAGRDLSGQVSKHSYLGRERCAYFFWQGCDSTINEKGASALMTVELDEERGPHVRVVQGQEPPCFLNLFKGSMAVHLGKREDESPIALWRLFVVRGELENEAHIVEVPCNKRSLRSWAAFVLVNSEECLAFLWFGMNIKEHVKEVARSVFDIVEGRKPLEFGFKIGVPVLASEETEGSESEEFLKGLGEDSESDGLLVVQDVPLTNYTPRMFYMSSVSGVFTATEVTCSFWTKENVCSYPFLQTELYKVPQPALFVMDCGSEVYLWQGWWPESTDDNDNMSTGSAHLRFSAERRLAMETVLQYCTAKYSENPPTAYAVWAGLEPLEFKHVFSQWEDRPDVFELNLREGRVAGEKKLLKDVLVQLKRTRYTFAELQERPLPDGVDPSILESYLTSEEFQEVLKMSKKDFYALPSWKQYNLRKASGLY